MKRHPIEKHRKRKGLSRAKLALLVGCDQMSTYRHERRGMVPKPAVLERYAEVLGVSVKQLSA